MVCGTVLIMCAIGHMIYLPELIVEGYYSTDHTGPPTAVVIQAVIMVGGKWCLVLGTWWAVTSF